MEINLGCIRQAEGLLEEITQLKNKLEERINLSQVVGNEKRLSLTMNKVLRICLIAGLSISEKRREDYKDIKLSTNRLFETIFSYNNMRQTWIALLKMRYSECVPVLYIGRQECEQQHPSPEPSYRQLWR